MMSRLLLFIALLASPAYAAASDDAIQKTFQSITRGNWGEARIYAKKSGNEVLAKIVTWQYLLDAGSGATFVEIEKFIHDNPGWPEIKKLHLRAEQSLKDSKTSNADILRWFDGQMPVSGAGKIALAKALGHISPVPQPRIEALVREAWRDGDFEEAQEKDILSAFGKILSAADHLARADRLLWEEKLGAAKRMLKRVNAAHQHLIEARMALISGKRTALWAEAKVPKELHTNAGLLYDRTRYYARRGDDNNVRHLLAIEPENVPYPERWWKLREAQVRTAIAEKKYGVAEELLRRYEQLPNTQVADARWLTGWLQLQFLHQPKKARETFERMYESVKYPASRSRAAYWAARAAETDNDKNAAENWYATAGAWPTTFYGQISIQKRLGDTRLRIPSAPEISEEEKSKFADTELAHAAALCLKYKQKTIAARLLNHMIETTDDAGYAAMAANLGVEAEQWYLGVRAAKKAIKKGIVLMDSGYPQPKISEKLPIERALVLSISRQESEFDAGARSPSNALGLMQLRAATAKEAAHKAKVSFNKNRLFEPGYNMLLGSHYLARLIKSYDGSYVMAIAAYNAGPGNVRKWTKKFGSPGKTQDAVVDWIEKIPFEETRNYVQRVLENLQVYRALNGKEKLEIAGDLTR